jgi:alkylation response protein AidB-like acyl-CoA dehydrogenase
MMSTASTTPSAAPETVEAFVVEARRWLQDSGLPQKTPGATARWGEGSDAVPVFDDVPDDEQRARLLLAARWHQRKLDAGYALLTWPAELGGRGLPARYQAAFNELESGYQVPQAGELVGVSVGLIARTLARFGSVDQRDVLLPPLLRMEQLGCQLFSEPGAGSDLAGLTTRARQASAGGWTLSGQKVWTSGAQFCDRGLAIARHDLAAPKHRGLTAFLVPMKAPGMTVRPIRQMTGGSSFNEVFLDDVEVGDDLRIGDVGAGWTVAMTTLSYERDHSAGGSRTVGGDFDRVLATAARVGADRDPVIRQLLADLYIHLRAEHLLNRRVAAAFTAGAEPGPTESIGKLVWSQNLTRIGAVISEVLGARIAADTGEWGTYAWAEHLLGAPGYRIAGGSDEIQRNIIGERVLGLPREPAPNPPTGGRH